MKRELRVPYFETGVKCYIYGQEELDFALEAERLSLKYDIDVLFISSFVNLKTIAEQCPHLFVIAPGMDNIRPGRGMGKILPESLKAAGAAGAVINHCERPMSLSDIRGGIERCRELDMLSFVCTDTISEAMAVANLGPDIMNPEPSELIGTGVAPDMSFVNGTVGAVKKIDPNIITEIAAGISDGEDVYDFIMAGSDGAGAASGILRSEDPFGLLEEMIAAVKRAKDDINKARGTE